MTVNMIEHFASLKDPGIERNKLHALMDIIVLVIGGVISGLEYRKPSSLAFGCALS